ncbi:MAG: hypothetical protein A4E73_01381 [Syntrophaceae bacterium PtaU1.Bin231]|nr:MAG: hypothetical protein A4E73_01381 [Syntrophaceae bacterium PtaU1.Bin231]
MLSLDPRDGLLDVGEDGALEKVAGAALADQPAEDVPVKSLGDRLPLFLGVGEPFQRRKKFLPCVDEFDGHAEGREERDNLLRLILPHDPIVDEVGFQPLAQCPVPQHRDGRGIHPSRQGVDGKAVTDGRGKLLRLLPEEGIHAELLQLDFFQAHNAVLLFRRSSILFRKASRPDGRRRLPFIA